MAQELDLLKYKSSLTYPGVFHKTGKAPLDDRTVVKEFGELTAADAWDKGVNAYTGMVVGVVDDTALYMLLDGSGHTNADNWKKIGGADVQLDTTVVTVTYDPSTGKYFEGETDVTDKVEQYETDNAPTHDGSAEGQYLKFSSVPENTNDDSYLPVSKLINIKDYYTATEVDDLLANKVDDISTNVEDDISTYFTLQSVERPDTSTGEKIIDVTFGATVMQGTTNDNTGIATDGYVKDYVDDKIAWNIFETDEDLDSFLNGSN